MNDMSGGDVEKPTMAQYLIECAKSGILTAVEDQHKGSIDALCKDGVLSPISFIAFDGKKRTANCTLSAIDHLRKLGQYNQHTPVIWL
jgi:hypothetical protein